MKQEFNLSANVHINRDDKGVPHELLHTCGHIVSQAPTAQLAATEYLGQYGKLLGIQSKELQSLALSHETELVATSGSELRFHSEKQNFDMKTVTFQQTHFGLPVWHSAVSVQMKQAPFRVVSAQSTRHADLKVKRPRPECLLTLKNLDADTLAKRLGLFGEDSQYDSGSLKIEAVKLVIFRYHKAKRVLIEEPSGKKPFDHHHPTLALPPLAKNIHEGRHYVSAEAHFALGIRGHDALHWVAIVEAESLSILYLRAFVDNANGMVFQDDPVTTNGGPAPSATTAALNPVRTSVALQGLSAPVNNEQSLSGDIVQVRDVEPPPVASPNEPTGTDFGFDSRTNNFSAVNAYYHCDRFFRLMEDLGFSLSTFFGTGTPFPSAVDHRGSIGTANGVEINAHCVGTSGGTGIARTTFALADLTDTTNPLGIACDYRVVLHELGGHGVLYPHVHSPNFGFSHSAGDSVAAITCDPDTHAADRFLTFPWVNIGRRHDRAVAAGWGWAGSIALNPFDPVLDRGGYSNEQILCTTLFRLYRSIGGDSADLPTRRFASRYAVYLILRAISTLTPATNPSNAAGFATALITADLGDWTSAGETGGAYGKVIRWAFEKQGLYQPAGTPTPNNNIGAPPAVDVYIEDGRHGEYPYQPNHWSCQAIWNRRHNDNGTTHEEPVVGVANFAYVKIKNRGTQVATNVVVKAYHANPAAGLVYPNDWQPMTTPQLAGANVPPNNGAEITVGPFAWTPGQVGHECMFMVVSASGDSSNTSNLSPGESIPEWRLVPNDNNIGQRNVFPVAGGGGLKGLRAALDGLKIQIKNPLHVPARVIVTSVLPRFLVTRGWQVGFANTGEGAFSLKPAESKTIVLKIKTGKDFSASQVRKAKDAVIHIEARANGILVGGMSFQLDPNLKIPVN